MKSPELIQLSNDCKSILSKSFKAVAPEEGCSILIGNKTLPSNSKKKEIWQISHIWTCSNSWGEIKLPLPELKSKNQNNTNKMTFSKKNRFLIDPREQFAAQRWSRANNCQILGSAHSHPNGDNEPSQIDLEMHHNPGLMIIANKSGDIEAWWIENKQTFHRVKLAYLSLQ